MKPALWLPRWVRLLMSVMVVCAAWPSQPVRPLIAAEPFRVGGPDAFNMGFLDTTEPGGPVYDWRTTASGTNLNLTDASSALLEAPFPISLYGVVTTTLNISNNGVIRVGNGPAISDANQSLYELNTPNMIIAPFWDDLATAWTKGVSYDTLGTAPNRQFVIWWEMMPHFPATSNTIDVQVVFNEQNDDIIFQYQDVVFGTSEDSGASATVGIRGGNPASALQYSFNEPALSAGLAIRFYRLPPTVTLAPTSAAQAASPSSTAAYPLTFTNWTDATRTFTVTYDGAPFIASGIDTFTLPNGASQTFTTTVAVPADAALGSVGINTVSVTTDDPQFATSATLTTTATLTFACAGVPVVVPSGFPAGVSVPITVEQVPVVGSVSVDVAIDVPFASTTQSLVVDLIAPSGTKIRLHNFSSNPVTGNYTQTLPVDGPGNLTDLAGEYGNGAWAINVIQPVAGATATLKSCRLNFSPPPSGLFLSPPRQTREVPAGTAVDYGFRLINNTPQTQTVALSYTTSRFAATGPATLTVPLSSSLAFTVNLQVDSNAFPLVHDDLVVNAISQSGMLSATATTLVVPPTWLRRANLPSRVEAAATATLNGSLMVIGGRRPSSSVVVDMYNPQTNSWSSGPSLPAARAFAGAAVLSDTLYLVGGDQLTSQPQNTVFTFSNGTWGFAPSLPTPLAASVVVADPATNRLYAFGGRINGTTNVSKTLMFDGNTWMNGPPIPVPFGGLSKAAGTRLDRHVYITGGEYSGAALNKLLFVYDLDSQTWRLGPSLPEPRVEAGMAAVGDSVCVVGGANPLSNPSIQATTWCFDRVGERWFRAANLNVARQRLAVTEGPDGIYAIGGVTSGASDASCNASQPRLCQTVERYAEVAARFQGASKTVTPTVLLSGEPITYSFQLSNGGQIAATAYLTDTVDSRLTILAMSPELSAAGQTVTGAIPLLPNQTRILTFTAYVPWPLSGVITNQAHLSGDGNIYLLDSAPVTVYAAPTAVAINSSSPDTVGQSTVLTASTDVPVTGYRWDFGDGASGVGEVVTHTYSLAGVYSVTVFVDWGPGYTNSLTHSVEIHPAPSITLESSSPDALGMTTYFTPTVTGTGLTYGWDFGDGSTSALAQPTHTYAAASSFVVTAVITDRNGVTASASITVEIDPAPSAAISLSSNPVLVGRTLVVTGTSSGVGTTYAWDFGDGTTSNGVTASHQYTQPGTYTITLLVTDRHGVTVTTTTSVQVRSVLWLPIIRK